MEKDLDHFAYIHVYIIDRSNEIDEKKDYVYLFFFPFSHYPRQKKKKKKKRRREKTKKLPLYRDMHVQSGMSLNLAVRERISRKLFTIVDKSGVKYFVCTYCSTFTIIANT